MKKNVCMLVRDPRLGNALLLTSKSHVKLLDSKIWIDKG